MPAQNDGTVNGRPGLPPPLDAEIRQLAGKAGPVALYVAGQGAPLLLIHSVNAAASAYEIKPIFDRARDTRHVYAIDLPGYGLSDRSQRRYDIRLFTDAIHDALDAIALDHGETPVDVLAVSLSCEFAARAATERPARFRTLTFVTPTGFNRGSASMRGPAGSSREVPGVYGFVNVPIWRQALFDLLVSRRSIAFFLRKTQGSKEIDQGLLDYDYLTTHQPGARHAPYAFVSGRLFSRDVRTLYESLHLPVWVPHATKGDFADFSETRWAEKRANWRFQPFDAGALVHFQHPDAFFRSLEEFLAGGAQHSASPG
jgi:pimeloyl-ACP methyl ester carboxylesterase